MAVSRHCRLRTSWSESELIPHPGPSPSFPTSTHLPLSRSHPSHLEPLLPPRYAQGRDQILPAVSRRPTWSGFPCLHRHLADTAPRSRLRPPWPAETPERATCASPSLRFHLPDLGFPHLFWGPIAILHVTITLWTSNLQSFSPQEGDYLKYSLSLSINDQTIINNAYPLHIKYLTYF